MPAVIFGLESVMQTIVDWFREHEGWRRERCVGCGGHGVVSDYSCGEDFYGPKECDCCVGTGVQWRTPRGRYVRYPGGPSC
jgi:hypothetical protein